MTNPKQQWPTKGVECNICGVRLLEQKVHLLQRVESARHTDDGDPENNRDVVYSLQLESTSPFIYLIGVMVAKLYNWPCRQVHNPLSQSFLCRGSMMRRWRAESVIISSYSIGKVRGQENVHINCQCYGLDWNLRLPVQYHPYLPVNYSRCILILGGLSCSSSAEPARALISRLLLAWAVTITLLLLQKDKQI